MLKVQVLGRCDGRWELERWVHTAAPTKNRVRVFEAAGIGVRLSVTDSAVGSHW